MTKITPICEQYVYDYKGISIGVSINYDRGQISLVEKDGKPKKWLFAERETDYMTGWVIILEAMKKAIKDAQKRLDAWNGEKKDRYVDLVAAALTLKEESND